MRAYLKLAAIVLVGVALQMLINYGNRDDIEDAVFTVRAMYISAVGTDADLDRLVEDGRVMLTRRVERRQYEYDAEHPDPRPARIAPAS